MLRATRAEERALLLAALKHANALPRSFEPVLAGERPYPEDLPEEICVAAHAMLAKASSRLIAVQLEDLAGVKEQANVPGTVHEHPNWRCKLPYDLADLVQAKLFQAVTGAVSRERPRSP